ncbi:MAG: RHS repeat protein [Flammeovirgaceae bacterium]|nr:RHS repeat protein [Flammeovirgaceae bacterium]
MKNLFLISLPFVLFITEAKAQIKGFKSPMPPDVFQFTKFNEIPVSEYTGIPDIKIPIHTVNSGEIVLPIDLSYHAGGIRVSEEASWVGLGWNLQVGSITQIVNDRDDLSSFQKILPDYYYYGHRFDFQWRHAYPYINPTPPFGFSPSTGISPDQPYHSFVSYTDYYFPLNGSYDHRTPSIANADGGPDDIDSEPDIFKASFNGHYIEFIRDFQTENFVVLNKKNYRLLKVDNLNNITWKVIAPNGIQYFFEEIDEEFSNLNCSIIDHQAGGTECKNETNLVSRIWHLTKIIDTAGRKIIFGWEKISQGKDLPSFSQKVKYKDYLNEQTIDPCSGNGKIYDFRSTLISDLSGYSQTSTYYDAPTDEYLMNTFISLNAPSSHSYLKEIQSANEKIVFKVSPRSDRMGELKLDSILVYNNLDNIIKTWKLTFDYFVSNPTTNSIDKNYPAYYTNNYFVVAEHLTHRLKLSSIEEIGNPSYQFTYDSEPLPIKTSYATDYWGFYNGVLSNNSFIPNPIHINKSFLGSNGNDRRSYLQKSRASTLIQIKYPTTAILSIEYELNTFDNASLIPITSGCGIRVKSTNFITDDKVARKTIYTYESGKLMVDLNLSGFYGYNNLSSTTVQDNLGAYTNIKILNFQVNYVGGNNFYSTSMLGSGNFIGYGKVTRKQVDLNNNAIGKFVSYYSNNPDIGAHDEVSDLGLPARKNHLKPDNGLLLKSEVYNEEGILLRKDSNVYTFQMSPIFYGAKVVFSNIYFLQIKLLTNPTCITYLYEQDLVGYYPIFSGESILSYTKSWEKSNSISLSTEIEYDYYPDNQIGLITTRNSSNEIVSTEFVYPTASISPYMTNLRSANILNEVIEKKIKRNGSLINKEINNFNSFNGLIRKSQILSGPNANKKIMNFNNYDSLGNPLEIEDSDGINQSFIWGYNSTLIIAKASNALSTEIAFTSFENENNEGGWTFNNSISSISKTGNFSFNGSSISKVLPNGNYILSFWAKRNLVNGNITGAVNLNITSDDWAYYSFSLSNVNSINISLSNVLIDELRVYPQGSQMSSFTHKPLVGVTSVSDENGIITYYEYDEQNRLQNVRDNRGNIVKNYIYHFKGQN